MNPELGALLLAAGGSRRLGECKQLVKLRGESLVHRAARLLLDLDPVITVAVVGAKAKAVREELNDLPVTIHENAAWRSGMGGSLAAGMRLIPDGLPGVLIMLCDQWRVDGDDLARLLSAWAADPARVAVAGWGESFGPPVIFPGHLFARLRKVRGDAGAKRVIEANGEPVRVIPLDHARYDLDDAADFESFRHGAGPSASP